MERSKHKSNGSSFGQSVGSSFGQSVGSSFGQSVGSPSKRKMSGSLAKSVGGMLMESLKREHLKGKAVFLIALLITLPIYISTVFAAPTSLSSPSLKGQDNRFGFVRKNDMITVAVTASLEGDSVIAPSQLALREAFPSGFDACTETSPGSTIFTCTKAFEGSTLTENPFRLAIDLSTDGGDPVISTFVDGTMDDIAPQLISFTIIPQKIAGGNVSLQWSLADAAITPATTNRCSGIKKIEFLSASAGLFKSIDINTAQNSCQRSDILSYYADVIAGTDGAAAVNLRAHDFVGNVQSYEASFTYDTIPPDIVDNSLQVVEPQNQGSEIIFTGYASVPAAVKFKINALDLNPLSVFANLQQLNNFTPADYGKKQATCTQSGTDEFSCTIPGITISNNVTKTASIVINASDTLGNLQTETLTKSLSFDNLGPSVSSLRTEFFDAASGKSYVGKETDFIVEMAEAGAGINKDDIALDLSQVNASLGNVKPTGCTQESSSFTCIFANHSPDGPDSGRNSLSRIKIFSTSKDKIGNRVSGLLEQDVIIDTVKPLAKEMVLTPKPSGEALVFPPFLKTGDSLILDFNITELSNIRAIADFSGIVTGQAVPVQGNCVRKDADKKEKSDRWTCTWNSDPIDAPGHILYEIPINVTDAAGNKLAYRQPIEVLEFSDVKTNNFWTSAVTCSPPLVDRQTTPQINSLVYCKAELSPLTNDQEVLDIKFIDHCKDIEPKSLDFVEKRELSNGGPGSTEPYLTLTLVKGEMKLDKLEFTCPLEIYTRAGTKITRNPEIEQIKLEVNFFNNPMGDFGKELKKEIEEAKDAANNVFFKIIGILKMIMKYIGMLCNVLQTIAKVWYFLSAIGDKITLAHLAMSGSPVEPVLGGQAAINCEADEGLKKVTEHTYLLRDENPIAKLCKFVNCQASPESRDSHAPDGKTTTKWYSFQEVREGLGSWRTKGNEVLGNMAVWKQGTIEDYSGKQPYQYMNARDNLLVALAMGCIPGIVNGIDNIRQIFCMYADCLQNNNFYNVPIKECKDQQKLAICKYVVGEIFAILPWTAFYFKYTQMIYSALQDPLTMIATAANFLTKGCKPKCLPNREGSLQYQLTLPCRIIQFGATFGEIVNDVEGIIGSFKDEKIDYCERI